LTDDRRLLVAAASAFHRGIRLGYREQDLVVLVFAGPVSDATYAVRRLLAVRQVQGHQAAPLIATMLPLVQAAIHPELVAAARAALAEPHEPDSLRVIQVSTTGACSFHRIALLRQRPKPFADQIRLLEQHIGLMTSGELEAIAREVVSRIPEVPPDEMLPEGIREAALLMSLETDRGSILVAAAQIDDMLKDLLLARMLATDGMSKKQRERLDNLVGINGALGVFSARIDLAYFLGLIAEDVHHDLHILREMRNDAAHRVSKKDFREETLASRSGSFKIMPAEVRSLPPRQRFAAVVQALMALIDNAIDDAEHASPRASGEKLQVRDDVVELLFAMQPEPPE